MRGPARRHCMPDHSLAHAASVRPSIAAATHFFCCGRLLSRSLTLCARACASLWCVVSRLWLAVLIANSDARGAECTILSRAAAACLRVFSYRIGCIVVELDRCSALCMSRACTAVGWGLGAVADLMPVRAVAALSALAVSGTAIYNASQCTRRCDESFGRGA